MILVDAQRGSLALRSFARRSNARRCRRGCGGRCDDCRRRFAFARYRFRLRTACFRLLIVICNLFSFGRRGGGCCCFLFRRCARPLRRCRCLRGRSCRRARCRRCCRRRCCRRRHAMQTRQKLIELHLVDDRASARCLRVGGPQRRRRRRRWWRRRRCCARRRKPGGRRFDASLIVDLGVWRWLPIFRTQMKLVVGRRVWLRHSI